MWPKVKLLMIKKFLLCPQCFQLYITIKLSFMEIVQVFVAMFSKSLYVGEGWEQFHLLPHCFQIYLIIAYFCLDVFPNCRLQQICLMGERVDCLPFMVRVFCIRNIRGKGVKEIVNIINCMISWKDFMQFSFFESTA